MSQKYKHLSGLPLEPEYKIKVTTKKGEEKELKETFSLEESIKMREIATLRSQ